MTPGDQPQQDPNNSKISNGGGNGGGKPDGDRSDDPIGNLAIERLGAPVADAPRGAEGIRSFGRHRSRCRNTSGAWMRFARPSPRVIARGTESCGRAVNSCRGACWGCSASAASAWPCRAAWERAETGTPTRTCVPDGSASRDMMEKSDPAINRGLAYLASHRNRTGSFGTNGYTGNVAVTSLSALAFMAGGQPAQPRPIRPHRRRRPALRPQPGEPARRPTRLLAQRRRHPHGPMYSHGFGTLFLAEVTGMVQDPALRDDLDAKLRRAVALDHQEPEQRGRLALQPRPQRGRYLGDHLPDHGPARRPQRRRRRAQVHGRSLRPVRHGLPGPPIRIFPLSERRAAAARTARRSRGRPPAWSPSTAPATTSTRTRRRSRTTPNAGAGRERRRRDQERP